MCMLSATVRPKNTHPQWGATIFQSMVNISKGIRGSIHSPMKRTRITVPKVCS